MIRFALAALSMLIATATNSIDFENFNPITAVLNGGDTVVDKIQYQKKYNQLIADTLTFEEYAEWLSVQQKFQAKETQQKDEFLSCIEKGTNKKTCVDPHWCLYPSNLETDECVWYKIKYNL